MDIMLDIETLGTGRDSVIISIGAVAFNPFVQGAIGSFFHRNLTIFDQLLLGRVISPETVDWWKKQSFEARNALHIPAPITLDKALAELSKFIQASGYVEENETKIIVWAKSPEFDCAILEHAYTQCDLLKPWDFRSKRDVRTVCDVAARKPNALPPRVTAQPPSAPSTAHTVLGDCFLQIRAVQMAIATETNC